MANSKKEQEDYDALTTAISRVLAPVVICMILSVYLVNSTGPGCPSKKPTPTWKPLPAFRPSTKPEQSQLPAKGEKLEFTHTAAIIFICSFCVLIVVFTYLIVFLFKRGHTRFIAGWLFVAVFVIFSYVGGIYLFEFARSQCFNLDWITLCFVVWNFTVTGIVAVFGNVPRFVNQAYLIVMSSLMAYVFRTLPPWTIWTLLGVLVVWDLFAVLTPIGPLRALVEHAKKMNQPLPALIYDTDPRDIGRDPETTPAVVFTSSNRNNRRNADNETDGDDTVSRRRKRRSRRRKREEEAEASNEEAREESNEMNATDSQQDANTELQMTATSDVPPNENEGEETEQKDDSGQKVDDANESRPQEKTNDAKAIGTLGTHLKLGLGDFVFYSILVAVASQSGSMTTVMSFVAILAGLCMTLFLVLVYRKALPALPISIVFGIIFYFLTVFTVEPMVQSLFVELAYH